MLLVRKEMVDNTQGEGAPFNRSVIGNHAAGATPRHPSDNKEDRMNSPMKAHNYYALFAELSLYLREKKSYWLAPVIFVLLALSALAFFLEGSVLAPAIYSVF